MDWSTQYSARGQAMNPSMIREILKLTQKGNVISFAGGLPAPSLFPKERFAEISERLIREQGETSLQYSTTDGDSRLREWLAEYHQVDSSNIQITTGSQQALDLVGKILLDANDTVIVAAPTYLGALQSFTVYQPNYVTVPSDGDGMVVDGLEEIIQKYQPKLLYVIPNFDNPSGAVMSLERRQQLVALAQQYNLPIFEDDPYGELYFTGERLPRLRDLAPECVIYASSFSKILAPGLRVAWVCADAAVRDKLAIAKQGSDLHTPTLTQMLLAETLQDQSFWQGQLENIRSYYRKQRDLMMAAVEKYLPSNVHYHTPNGGMFLWLTLEEGIDTMELFRTAVDHGVAYVPGTTFFANGGGHNTMRLSYSVATAEQIDTGMQALSKVLTNALQPA